MSAGRMHDFAFRDLEIGDTGWLIEQHACLCAASTGSDATFEAVVGESLAAFIFDHDPSRERAFIADRAEMRLGSIFSVRTDTPDIAKLRLFLVLPKARGLGIGRQLLTECLSFARSVGYAIRTLWTKASVAAGHALYAEAGFRCTASQRAHEFGVEGIDETWQIGL